MYTGLNLFTILSPLASKLCTALHISPMLQNATWKRRSVEQKVLVISHNERCKHNKRKR
jgi:hypothetical protein